MSPDPYQKQGDKKGAMALVKAPPIPENNVALVDDIKVKTGQWINKGQLVIVLKTKDKNNQDPKDFKTRRIKSEASGTVLEICVKKGDEAKADSILARISLTGCPHSTIMKNMCADCGADLENEEQKQDKQNQIAMIHSIPELKVSTVEAESLGREDERRLLSNRRLVLLVDLDQTLIHTTNDNIPPNIQDVKHFQLGGPQSPWYHTRIRPKTSQFLKSISQYYELHIFTYGARLYAHTVAKFLDQDSQLFSHRILSRDECFDSRLKTANLPSLFPCGDHMVCIIDDREDVWNFAPNLVHVKPYIFFKNVGDINAPEKLQAALKQKEKTISKKNSKAHDDKECITSEDTSESVSEIKSNETADSTTLAPPSDETNTKQDRRDSIDMPTFEGAKLPLRNADTIKDAEMEGTASVVSDDLELSDDNGSNSGIGSNTSSNENGRNNDVAKSVEIINDHPFKSIATVKIPDQSQDTSEKSLYLGKPINKSFIPGDCNEGKSTTEIANDEHKSIIDKSKDTVSAATTEDSDSSAKSGMENDGDEFNLKKEGDKADKSSTEIEDDLFLIEDTDDYLLYLEDTLKNIHKAYYEAYDRRQGSGKIPDLKDVIPSVKRVSLKGTSIVFSGVIPTNIPVERSKPYLVARSLGAEVTERITRKTTHLVAARTGTAKVNEAKKRAKNVHLVTPDWLWCCAERWERIDERLYPLYKSAPITVKPPAHCSSPEDNASARIADYDPTNFDFSGRPKSTERQASSESMPESINPFFTLSTEDFKGMDKEVDDILSNESSSSSSSDEDEKTIKNSGTSNTKNRDMVDLEQVHLSESSNSDTESLTGEYPRGMKRKHAPDKNGSEGDDEDEFGATEGRRDGDALERFKQGGMVPEDFEIEPASDDEDGDEDRAMAEQLEREFMEGEDSLSNSNF